MLGPEPTAEVTHRREAAGLSSLREVLAHLQGESGAVWPSLTRPSLLDDKRRDGLIFAFCCCIFRRFFEYHCRGLVSYQVHWCRVRTHVSLARRHHARHATYHRVVCCTCNCCWTAIHCLLPPIKGIACPRSAATAYCTGGPSEVTSGRL